MFKVSAVSPRRSAVLTVFRGATAINEGTTAEPRRSWRCHCVLCRTNTAMAPRLRCDGGRRSAVLTVFRGATAINEGTTAEPPRSWRCHCGLSRTSTAVAPRLRCDGGIKHAGAKIHLLLSLCFNACMVHGFLPSTMTDTILVPIIKDKTCNASSKANYRPIALTSDTV